MGKRIIRFPLKMKNGAEVRTLDELKENFDLESVLGYFSDGKLKTWLADRYYDDKAKAVLELSADTPDLNAKLCEILEVEYRAEEDSTDFEYIRRRNEKRHFLSQTTADEILIKNIDSVALNQNDLNDCINMGIKTIYLVGETTFLISLKAFDTTFIGVNGAKAVIRAEDNVNFKKKNISFKNIQFGWDTSDITQNDKVAQAEYIMSEGKYEEAHKILEEYAKNDHPKAIELLKECNDKIKEANRNSREKIYYDGIIANTKYFSGDMICSESLYLFEKSAALGYEPSKFYVDIVEHRKKGQGEIFLKHSKEKNEPEAFYYDAMLNFNHPAKSYGIKSLITAAELGHIPSLYQLGLVYQRLENEMKEDRSKYGIVVRHKENLKNNIDSLDIVESSENTAIALFKSAAEAGFPLAMLKLGEYDENQQNDDALKWYLKAAELGYPPDPEKSTIYAAYKNKHS